VSAAPGAQAPALQLNFDDDVTDGDTSWKGRMVFEPYHDATVTQDEWQCWDAMAGLWWGSGAPLNTVAPQSSPQSMATILATFPNAGSNSAFGGLIVKAGSGWSSFDGNVDALSVGIDGAETIFDFEGGAGRQGRMQTRRMGRLRLPQPGAVHQAREHRILTGNPAGPAGGCCPAPAR
jgi:hypothetical protein